MQPEPDAVMLAARNLLYRLGVTAQYVGFFHASYAVWLVVQTPTKLQSVTKGLYQEVAAHYGTTWRCVERNIRTAVQTAWRCNHSLLEELAQRPLLERPSASAFLSILSYDISESEFGLQNKENGAIG